MCRHFTLTRQDSRHRVAKSGVACYRRGPYLPLGGFLALSCLGFLTFLTPLSLRANVSLLQLPSGDLDTGSGGGGHRRAAHGATDSIAGLPSDGFT